jgi:hypothetical protein
MPTISVCIGECDRRICNDQSSRPEWRLWRVSRVCFGPCRKHLPPRRGGLLFWWGRVANPPNPETRRGSLDGSGRDALHGIPVHSTLPGVPWSPALSWLHTALAGSCCRDPRLSSHVLIRSAMLSRERHVALSVDDLNHYYFYCHR